MQTITPCIWFDDQAEAAAEFYVSVVPNSRILRMLRPPGPDGSPGAVIGVDFVLDGVAMQGINGGPMFPLSPAFSLVVSAPTQPEIDDLWEKLLADGGEPSQCGWLTDKFGLSWQVIPPLLLDYLADPDPVRAGRVMQAMLTMTKIEIPALQAAYDGS